MRIKKITVRVETEVELKVDTGPRGEYVPAFDLVYGGKTVGAVTYNTGNDMWEARLGGFKWNVGRFGTTDAGAKKAATEAVSQIVQQALQDRFHEIARR